MTPDYPMTPDSPGGDSPAGESPAGERPTGRVSFVGAGPGAADLITLRGARRIGEADVVIWSASLVPAECVREHARPEAELVDSTRFGREELVEIYRRAERDRLAVARVHSGDPTLWGAVQDQYDACARMRLDVEIVPGVTGFSAAAAAVGRELTSSDAGQPVMVSRMDGGKVAMPGRATISDFAERGATVALSVSAARTGSLVEELRAGGYGDDVAVVIAYKPSAPDELLLRTTLGELHTTVKQHKLWRNTLFLVGPALASTGRSRGAGSLRTDGAPTTPEPGGRPWRVAAGTGRDTGARGRSGSGRWSATTVVVDNPGAVPAGEGGVLSAGDADVGSGVQGVRRPGQPDSAVAWWAVRDWQRTARGTARIAAARASGRTVTADSAQPALFVDTGDRVSEPEQVTADGDGSGAGREALSPPSPSPDEAAADEAAGVASDDETGAVEPGVPDAVETGIGARPGEPAEAEEPSLPAESAQQQGPEPATRSRSTSGSAGGPGSGSTKTSPSTSKSGTGSKSKGGAKKASAQAKRKPAAESNVRGRSGE